LDTPPIDRSPEASERVAALQDRLGAALAAKRTDSTTDHVMVVLPSCSVSESILSPAQGQLRARTPRPREYARVPKSVPTQL
jgi:hypothetical protein